MSTHPSSHQRFLKSKEQPMQHWAVQMHGEIHDAGYHERPIVYAADENDAIRRAIDERAYPAARIQSVVVEHA